VFGAFSDSNPVVDGFGNFKPSVKHFVDVLGNENVHLAFFNALGRLRRRHDPGGGDRPCLLLDRRAHQHAGQGLHASATDPAVRAAAGRGRRLGILGSPKTGLLNIALKWLDIDSASTSTRCRD